MFKDLKISGTAAELSERTALCEKIQEILAGTDFSVCMDALTSLLVHGAISINATKDTFISRMEEAYDLTTAVHKAADISKGTPN